MRFSLSPYEARPGSEHTTVRVFVSGASAGLLTMRNEELADFKRRLEAPAPDDQTGAPGSIVAELASANDARALCKLKGPGFYVSGGIHMPYAVRVALKPMGAIELVPDQGTVKRREP